MVEAVVDATDPTTMDRLAVEATRSSLPLDVRVEPNPGRDRIRFTVRILGGSALA